MTPDSLNDRLESLIDELILDGGVVSASLASILMAAKDSVTGDYHGTLSRRVWAASNDLRAERARDSRFDSYSAPTDVLRGWRSAGRG